MKPWTITIKNKKTYKGDGTYVGRPNALGNPFEIGRDGGRREVIEKYRKWLTDEIRRDNAGMWMFVSLFDEVHEKGELILICWCAPKECHADVIKEFLMEAWEELSRDECP